MSTQKHDDLCIYFVQKIIDELNKYIDNNANEIKMSFWLLLGLILLLPSPLVVLPWPHPPLPLPLPCSLMPI